MNDSISEEVSIEEIHQVQLELMKKFAKICDEQGLTYFLYWGTLIGAIRHNGFIPWDDDADIVMLRPDYEKLVSYLTAHEAEYYPLRLMHYSTNKKYIYPIARICDMRYTVKCNLEPIDYGLGIFLDLYPFDGWSNREGKTPAGLQKKRPLWRDYRYACREHFPKSKTAKWKMPFRWVLYRRARMLGLNRIAEKMDRLAKQFPVENYTYVGNLNWAEDDREGTEKANLVPIKHRFEDTEFTIPQGYDKILRDYYGDYMQPPPEEERVGHHSYTAYRFE